LCSHNPKEPSGIVYNRDRQCAKPILKNGAVLKFLVLHFTHELVLTIANNHQVAQPAVGRSTSGKRSDSHTLILMPM